MAMQATEETRGAWRIVSAEGRIDNTTADPLTPMLLAAIAAHPRGATDCSAVDCISSAGLQSLLEASARRGARRATSACVRPARV